jgi:uncharacterized protein (TIGR03437 family)
MRTDSQTARTRVSIRVIVSRVVQRVKGGSSGRELRLSAHAGEVITFYGIGFGPVAPLPATGKPAGSSPLSTMNSAPSVTINAENATVLFAGLSPGSAGLYQFNVVISDQKGSAT